MGTTPRQDFSHLKDVMGTLPMVKRYMVLSLIFPLDEAISVAQTEHFLRDSLARLARAFPHLAGQVVYEGRDEDAGTSGVPMVVPLSPEITIMSNDLRHETSMPSLGQMSDAKYPFAMLDPAVLAPSIAVSWSADGYDKIAPYLILQANFVRGGLILTVCGNHTQMDMTGMGIIISQLSQACRNEPFTEEEVRRGNQPRGNVIQLLDESYQPGPEIEDAIASPPTPGEPDPLSTGPRWAYFHFSASSLLQLKFRASDQQITPYISTDDAIAALCWQRLTAVRSNDLGSDKTTTFCRPISVRKWLNLQGYTGHMVDCVFETDAGIDEKSLGETAGRIRKLLTDDERIIHHVRAFATILSRLDDKSKLANGAKLDAMRDFVLSSYANIKCCDLNFGLLGRPEAARRPRMPVWPSLCYLMPKSRDGSIAVGFCLGEKDMRALRNDPALAEFAEYIG